MKTQHSHKIFFFLICTVKKIVGDVAGKLFHAEYKNQVLGKALCPIAQKWRQWKTDFEWQEFIFQYIFIHSINPDFKVLFSSINLSK